MNRRQRSLIHLRIVGYFNMLAIFLGLTRLRIDIKTRRVIHSRLVALYVISANIAYLSAMPFFYVGEAINASIIFDNNLVFLTESVNMLINFAATALSVLLRGQREAIHLEITETVIALDRRHFRHMRSEKKPTTNFLVQLLYFKMFTLCLQIVVPFYDWLTLSDELYVNEFLQTLYYDYTQTILATAIFMYFYGMWLLRKRFCLLNTNVLQLLQQLQQLPIRSRRTEDGSSTQQQRLVVEATAVLIDISQIHGLLSRLLSHLNRDYKVPILAVLLKNVIECISFGYYFTSGLDGSLDWEFDIETVLFFSYAVILFVDLNLVYYISDMTIDAQNQMSTIMRRFQLLPSLGDEFDQQCELVVLQLKRQQMDSKFAGMFQLNRQRALALWAFSLTQIIVLVQFDVGSRLKPSTENVLLNKLDKLFRVDETQL